MSDTQLKPVKNLLERRNRLYARLAVPLALRPIIGKREMIEALGADRREALRKLPGVIGRMQDVLNEARSELETSKAPAPRPPRPGQPLSIRNLAKAHFASEMALDTAERAYGLSKPEVGHLWEVKFARPIYRQKLKEVVSGQATDEEIAAVIGWAIDDFAQRGNTTVIYDTPQWRELARNLAAIQLEVLRLRDERDTANFSGEPTHALLVDRPPPANDPLKARLIGPDSALPMAELVERFIVDRRAGAETTNDHRVTIRMLDEVIGEPLPIYRLTRQHVHAFKRALAEAPANAAKRFPGKTLSEAIKLNAARRSPFPLLNSRTVNDKYLSRLHAFLAWAVRSDILPDNPASGVKVETLPDTEAKRLPFTPDDLSRLFGKHFAPDGKFGATQWAMLIALFSGMRASELAQMKLDSIRTERGILVFAVEEKTKTKGSRRLIPVHSKLKSFGIEKLVDDLRRRGATHLLPEWYSDGINAKERSSGRAETVSLYFARFIPRRFSATYMPRVGIVHPKKSWHSLRHTFKTSLALAGVGRDLRDELCGHVDSSAGSAYVHDTSLDARRDAIEKLTFDGLAL